MKKKTAKKIFAGIAGSIVLVICVLSYCIFSKSEYKSYVKDNSANVFAKLKTLNSSLKPVELEEEDINQILDFSLAGKIARGDLNIEKSWAKMEENQITLYALTDYKNLHVLLSTKGTISYGDNLVYTPKEFKVGKLPVSKKMVMDKLMGALKGIADIKGDNIIVSKDKLPLSIKNMVLNNGKLCVTVKEPLEKQFLNKMHKDLNTLTSQVKDEKILSKINKAKGQIKSMISDIKDESAETSNKNVASAKSNTKVKAENEKATKNNVNINLDASLGKAAGELSMAKSAVSSSGGRQIIDIMRGTVSTLKGNPKYNYSGDMGEVIGIYRTLTPEQKKNLKSAIYSNVDVGNAVKLRSMFGI
ncbi:hypothetical protein ACER0A_003060 [Haloimpatiens sp. FM7315]|uniref:hypothetical protein n=1 Tax=Haloimpatiens sp. FM7315 TaxID=3298609 RepID=UPI00370C6A3C